MITAETSPKCGKFEDLNTNGPISVEFKGMYGEYQIINYFKEAIYVIDFENKVREIVQSRNTIQHDPYVEIIFRSTLGARSFNEYRKDNTKATHRVIKIPSELLRYNPVFCEIINMVITTEANRSQALHPHSAMCINERMHAIQAEVARTAVQMPLTIIGNDPTGVISDLFVEIDGRICAAKMTHFKDEPDTLCIAYRDLMVDTCEHHTIRTTFEELRKQNPYVWTIENCTISSSRAKLKQYLEIHSIRSTENTISLAKHIEQMDEVRKLGVSERDRLTEDIAALKRKLSTANNLAAELGEGDFSTSAAEVKFQELEIERMRLENERLAMEHEKAQREFKQQQDELKFKQEKAKHENEQKMEKEKLRREYISTAVGVVKLLAVVVPIAFGIYKAIKSR